MRVLASVPPFPYPRPELEQVETPVPAAVLLLELAHALGDLRNRSVLDLGSGTGRLAIGAAALGAKRVLGIETDALAVERARQAAEPWHDRVRFRVGEAHTVRSKADTVVMNPPFGAQRRGADRPFWEAAYRLGRGRIYAFSLSESRSFILKRAVAAHAHVEAMRPVTWDLPRQFPFHRRNRVALKVDLWVIRTEKRR